MKKVLALCLLVSAWAFFIPPAYADGNYIGCDNLDYTNNQGNTTPAFLCTGGSITKNLTLYAIEMNLAINSGSSIWYKDVNGGPTETGCYPITIPAGVGTQFITLPTIFHYQTGDNPRVEFFNNSSCSSSASGVLAPYYTGASPYVFSSWIWQPLPQSGLFWNSATSSLSIFNSSTTVDIDTAFNSGGLSTTTIESYCDTNMPFDNSNIINATKTALPWAFCKTAFFVVVPTSDSVNQFATLGTDLQSRFPFSWFSTIVNTWNGLTASTTANSQTLEFRLHDLGIGSTTQMGNILPNVIVFSSSTVEQYFGGNFDTWKNLGAIAILLTLIADIFFTTRNMIKH